MPLALIAWYTFLTQPSQYSLSQMQVYKVLVAFLQSELNFHPDGFEILPDLRPITFASKSLSETEKCYSNIEWELLGIVFSVLHFKQYVYDHSLMVISDHKPHSTLFQKSLQSNAPRLTWMLLKISDYNINVVYWSGNTMPLSDALSWLNSHNVADGNKTEIRNVDVTIHDIEITEDCFFTNLVWKQYIWRITTIYEDHQHWMTM